MVKLKKLRVGLKTQYRKFDSKIKTSILGILFITSSIIPSENRFVSRIVYTSKAIEDDKFFENNNVIDDAKIKNLQITETAQVKQIITGTGLKLSKRNSLSNASGNISRAKLVDFRSESINFDVVNNTTHEMHLLKTPVSQSSRAALNTRGGMVLSRPIRYKINKDPESSFEVKIAPIVESSFYKIKFFNPGREFPLWIYFLDDRATKNPEIVELIKKIKGGALIESATALILIVIMWQILGAGEAFQFPLLHPSGISHHPANGGIQHQINHPKHGGRITVQMAPSSYSPVDQMQISSFIKDEKVNLRQCFDEVLRRAKEIKCEDWWSCTFERFKSLAIENGQISSNSAREAISILQGEMLGYYKDAERISYGGVQGIDFKVVGLGKYSHITHVEVKNPVGSEIEKTSRNGYTDIIRQGNDIGNKISNQRNKWCDPDFLERIPNLDPDAILPKTPENTLGLVDEFDVPVLEKRTIQNSIETGVKDSSTSSVVFINNVKNI